VSETPPDGAPLSAGGLERSLPGYEGQLVHAATVPASDGEYVDPGEVLRPALADRVRAAVGELYSHQADALDRLADGENVCVATSTSSGKTFVYALQIARNHLDDPESTALLVYPTKALSRDQQAALDEFFADLGLGVDVRVYDGDTPRDRRKHIRETADVVITNFAGVNAYLGSHARWRSFYRGCELLAVDESHSYTGVHGTHVAWTVRRLRRVLAGYGSDPQLVCTSATVGNPVEHSERLTGAPVAVVDRDGSPRGRREIAFWKPPVDEAALEDGADFDTFREATTSPVRETADLLAHLGLGGLQALAFTRSRKGAELGATYAREAAGDHPVSGELCVEPYHAGLGVKTRRGTEHRFKTGELDGITSTNALELGIDVGSTDATILTGYPGTRQSFWQQVGRSGRGEGDALSVFVARADAIDQYILDNPGYVLGDAVEDGVVGLENNAVYARHVLCAADERPLTAEDRRWFGAGDGDRLDRAVAMWRDAGRLAGDLSRGVRYTGSPRPQSGVSLYGASEIQFAVRCTNGEIDMAPVDRERAYRDHHEGALFLHDGAQYEVVGFDESLPNPSITVEEVRTEEYTETNSEKAVRDLEVRAARDLGDGYRVAWGTGTVEIHYTRYRRREIRTGNACGPPQPTGLEPLELDTELVWVETPPALREEILETATGEGTAADAEDVAVFGGGLHGAEHGMIKLTPLELRLDKSDLGGLSTPVHAETGVPTWFIHDAVDGGLGFSRRIYDRLSSIAARTRERVAGCDCAGTGGCPACIMDAQCGNGNRPLHTDATVAVLDRLLARL